ncbi:alpha/beta hydrolase [Lactobacillus sp. PV012]|uniref:alpha/beta hydrolase n=1 Tax=Lactobacillus sp. PV012 TaxID=2594494 RepID=UPI00223F3700|nr:alpha/beta hydrolase [Lactobacillus sp. PV012]QNQ81546.1 alpha/beta hydrolase [Lactobacillus sp. PV012]
MLKKVKKNKLFLILIFFLLAVLMIPTYFWTKNSNKDLAERKKSQLSPVIMVPGSSATTERFNELVSTLNKDTVEKHSVLKIKVDTDGQLVYSGKISKGDNEPFIIIGFENNKDGYSNIKKQASWLNIAFQSLSKQYTFNNFKAFGHSNGGLIWTYWLEHYYSDYSSEIKIKELMTVGTPFNFNETSISHKTQMLEDFIKNKSKIPSSLNVYSVSGGENYESDGLVPENSVEAGKYIFQNQVNHYTTMTVTGEDAQHSSLPQNKQVVQLIEQYLLKAVQKGNNGPQRNSNKKDKN